MYILHVICRSGSAWLTTPAKMLSTSMMMIQDGKYNLKLATCELPKVQRPKKKKAPKSEFPMLLFRVPILLFKLQPQWAKKKKSSSRRKNRRQDPSRPKFRVVHGPRSLDAPRRSLRVIVGSATLPTALLLVDFHAARQSRPALLDAAHHSASRMEGLAQREPELVGAGCPRRRPQRRLQAPPSLLLLLRPCEANHEAILGMLVEHRSAQRWRHGALPQNDLVKVSARHENGSNGPVAVDHGTPWGHRCELYRRHGADGAADDIARVIRDVEDVLETQASTRRAAVPGEGLLDWKDDCANSLDRDIGY